MTLALAVLALAGWLGLLVGRDRFWRNDQRLSDGPIGPAPPVLAVVPARNEAATITACLTSLAAQQDVGDLTIVVIDDGSTDGTAQRARAVARKVTCRIEVVTAPPPRPGWSGKVAAQAAGLTAADALGIAHRWLWLTDADIVHAPTTLRRLLATAGERRASLVSVMVQLSTATACERWLVPAFVYFFQLLYPFPAVNDPRRRVAAAAGGCILVERAAFDRAGGFAAIHDRLIDDVALADAVKRTGGALWLATDAQSRSLRRYELRGFARMVARTAFTELRHSYVRLAAALLGLGVLFLGPLVALAAGPGDARAVGAAALALMTWTYAPIVRAYELPSWWAVTLPAAALAYMAMTLVSAWRHLRGAGAVWHGRRYLAGTGHGAADQP